jgi:hypothetical protein
VCLCSCLSYSASNSHLSPATLSCYQRPLWHCHILHFYLISGTIFNNKIVKFKWVFEFPYSILSETFLILRRIQRDIVTNVLYLCPHVKCPFSLSYFKDTQIFSTGVSKEYSNIKFNKNSSSGSQFVTRGGPKNNWNLNVAHELGVVARCAARYRESTQYSSSLPSGVSLCWVLLLLWLFF